MTEVGNLAIQQMINAINFSNELIDEMDAIAFAAERRGKTLTMAEGLAKAWVSLGKQVADDNQVHFQKDFSRSKVLLTKIFPAHLQSFCSNICFRQEKNRS